MLPSCRMETSTADTCPWCPRKHATSRGELRSQTRTQLSPPVKMSRSSRENTTDRTASECPVMVRTQVACSKSHTRHVQSLDALRSSSSCCLQQERHRARLHNARTPPLGAARRRYKTTQGPHLPPARQPTAEPCPRRRRSTVCETRGIIIGTLYTGMTTQTDTQIWHGSRIADGGVTKRPGRVARRPSHNGPPERAPECQRLAERQGRPRPAQRLPPHCSAGSCPEQSLPLRRSVGSRGPRLQAPRRASLPSLLLTPSPSSLPRPKVYPTAQTL